MTMLKTSGVKRKGLGIAPYCLPEKAIGDPVTHDEMQREIRRLRAAIMRLASRSHDISQDDAKFIVEQLKEPYERDR